MKNDSDKCPLFKKKKKKVNYLLANVTHTCLNVYITKVMQIWNICENPVCHKLHSYADLDFFFPLTSHNTIVIQPKR